MSSSESIAGMCFLCAKSKRFFLYCSTYVEGYVLNAWIFGGSAQFTSVFFVQNLAMRWFMGRAGEVFCSPQHLLLVLVLVLALVLVLVLSNLSYYDYY